MPAPSGATLRRGKDRAGQAHKATGGYLFGMFEDWKHAWRQAVDNFRRELGTDEAGPEAAGGAGTRRELTMARSALRKLDYELRRAEEELERERREEATCRRREGLARDIGDEETARLAAEYAARSAECVAVLARKVEVLGAERDLRGRDMEAMEQIARDRQGLVVGPEPAPEPDHAEREAAEFRRMERSAREKAAQMRLEELRRQMEGGG